MNTIIQPANGGLSASTLKNRITTIEYLLSQQAIWQTLTPKQQAANIEQLLDGNCSFVPSQGKVARNWQQPIKQGTRTPASALPDTTRSYGVVPLGDVFVLDCDTAKSVDGEHGFIQLQEEVGGYGSPALPQTYVELSAHDGVHLFYRLPAAYEMSKLLNASHNAKNVSNPRNKVNVDIRAAGRGYVIAAGSRIVDDGRELQYRAFDEVDDGVIPEASSELIQFLINHGYTSEGFDPAHSLDRERLQVTCGRVERERRLSVDEFHQSLDELCLSTSGQPDLSPIPEGSRNNDLYTWVVGRLHFYPDEAEQIHCDLLTRGAASGLGEREVESIWKSALNSDAARNPEPYEAYDDNAYVYMEDDEHHEQPAQQKSSYVPALAGENSGRIDTDEQFWNSRKKLNYVHDWALASGLNPFALLGCCLMRISVSTPPNVVIPSFTGTGNSLPLGLFICLLAPSGGGKTSTIKEAEHLIPPSCVHNVFTAQVATGQAIAALFGEISTRKDGKRTIHEQQALRCRAINSVDEVTHIYASNKKPDSTLIDTITSAFTAGNLGDYTKGKDVRVTIPSFAYNLGMYMNTQPERLYMVLESASMGFPQRFIYLDARPVNRYPYPPLPERMELFNVDNVGFQEPSLDVLTNLHRLGSVDALKQAGNSYPFTVISFPETVRDYIRWYLDKSKHGEVDPLDAHSCLLRAKLAACFALLDERISTTEEDWHLACHFYKHSQQCRDNAKQEAIRKQISQQAKDKDQQQQVEEARHLETCKRYARNTLKKAYKEDPHTSMTGSQIKKHMGREQANTYLALEHLEKEGAIQRTTNTGKISSSEWQYIKH